MADGFVLWHNLSRNEMIYLFRLSSRSEKGKFLADRLGISSKYSEAKDELRKSAMTELFVNLLSFCKRQNMSAAKTSTLVSLVLGTHNKISGPPLLTCRDGFEYFKKMLLKHSVERPPFSIGVFSPADVKAAIKYILDTYFRHFKMYQFVFGETLELELTEEPEIFVQENPITVTGDESELNSDEDLKIISSVDVKINEKEMKDVVGLTDEDRKELKARIADISAKIEQDFKKQAQKQQEDFAERLKAFLKDKEITGEILQDISSETS